MRVYTQDWFSGNVERFQRYLNHFKDKNNLKFLEVGSFEGLSTNWLLDNILTDKSSKIFCIDTFEGSYEHYNLNLSNLYNLFLNNIEDKKDQVEIYKGKSGDILLNNELRSNKFDFIYIDGCHESKEVLEDAVLSWNLLKKDGIMIFDDYMWGNWQNTPTMCPKISVESFVNSYKDYLEILEISYQVVIKKVKGD